MRRVEKSRGRGVEEKTARRGGRREAGGGSGGDALAGIARGSARRQIIEPAMVEIRPEPSPGERAAILMALEKMLGATARDEPVSVPAWAAAGRREALLAGDRGSRTGWGQGPDRLADW